MVNDLLKFLGAEAGALFLQFERTSSYLGSEMGGQGLRRYATGCAGCIFVCASAFQLCQMKLKFVTLLFFYILLESRLWLMPFNLLT